MRYVIRDSRALRGKSWLLTLAPADGHRLSFKPGQYAALKFKRSRPTPARCFSMINAPNGEGILQFVFRNTGRYTRSISTLAAGSQVEVYGPFGNFTYHPATDSRSLMLAGGIGITPIFGILNSQLAGGSSNQFRLLYSARQQADVPLVEQLLALENAHPNLQIVFNITKSTVEKLGAKHITTGRITEALVARIVGNDFGNTTYFICGPDSFMDYMIKLLKQHNVPLDRIRTESFNQNNQLERRGIWNGLSRKLTSVYSLSTVTFLIILMVIGVIDISKNNAKAKALQAAQTTVSPTTQVVEPTTEVVTPAPVGASAPATPTPATPTPSTPTPQPVATTPAPKPAPVQPPISGSS